MMKMVVEPEEKKTKMATKDGVFVGREESAVGVGKAERAEVGNVGGALRTAEVLLRVVPMGMCLAALVIMLKNAQDNDYGSLSYSNLGAFTYLVYANGICAGYSIISAFYTAMPRPSTMFRAWTVFFFDQVLTYVILAAGAVSAEIIYLAYNGDEEVTWSEECSVFGGFCKRATASVGITLGAVFCYVLLSLISSYRLFSSYDHPLPSLHSRKAVDDVPAFAG